MVTPKLISRLVFFIILLLTTHASADRDFPAIITKVKDGDTVRACIDLGLGVFAEKNVRLYGIDAPDIHGKKHPTDGSAERSKARLVELVEGREVIIRVVEGATDKYGLTLGVILLPGGYNVNDALVSEGFAAPYLVKRR